MHRRLSFALFAIFECTQMLNEDRELFFNILFVTIVHLQSHIFNRVLIECLHFFFRGQKQRKRNLEQYLLNIWLYHDSRLFLIHALSQEFNRKCKGTCSHKLWFSFHDKLKVCSIESLLVLCLEFSEEQFILFLVRNFLLIFLKLGSTSKVIIILKSETKFEYTIQKIKVLTFNIA
jgi:hypothetical protein